VAVQYSTPVHATQFEAEVLGKRALAGGYFVLELSPREDGPLRPGDVQPGQFVMLRGHWGNELLNPRAFSVFTIDGGGRFSVLFKIYGPGTERLSSMDSGERLTVTGPLGRGFSPPGDRRQILVAGGVGFPPLFLQAQRAVERGLAERIEFCYGGRTASDLAFSEEIERMGIRLHRSTDDGSWGHHGRVTEVLARLLGDSNESESLEVLACGPQPMLAAVRKIGLQTGVPTWLCLEENMACGFGVCLGCAVPVYGARPYRYCCTDGPVFNAAEVRWP
jgi:dihydroorotate dehydrogenase electron transfer subunit